MKQNKYTLTEKVVSFMYGLYIKGVTCTSHIKIEGDLKQSLPEDLVIGFWHGDSFGMNFLLKAIDISQMGGHTYVIVTADKRGNYIERLLEVHGTKALRMPDGAKLRHFLRILQDVVKQSQTRLCVALDGPLGPLHEPKKLGAMLAYEGDKQYMLVKVNYTRKIRLTKRWDCYVIPLPFGEITFTGINQGKVSKEELMNFKIYKEELKNQLLF